MKGLSFNGLAKIACPCILVAMLYVAPLFAQNATVRIDSLTLDRAVALAVEHHSSLGAASANLDAASAARRQALSGYFPAIAFSASASHTEGVFVFNPSIAARNQIYSNYSTGLSAQQLIYDFGKTSSRVGANSDFVEASGKDFEAARENVIMGVQIAYFDFLQARQVARVNEEAVQQATDHLARAKAFFQVGRRPMFDVTKAEVDLANANVNQIRARNQSQVARLQLENAMGVHPAGPYAVNDSLPVQPVALSLDSAKALARERRPELLAAHARTQGLSSLANAAWSQHLPTISANGTWNWSGFDIRLYGRWTAGLTFSMPIFQGFGIDAQVQQARAYAEAADANLNLLTESAMLEVEREYLGVREAEERIAASMKLVEQAEENLRLAEKQYAAGIATAIEVTDAQVTRSNARITNIQALYDYNTSLIGLQRAIGISR